MDVVPREIFDPVPAGRLAPLYRLANRLHVRTRTSTVADQLLFAPGDRWTESRGRETERNLRALYYLTPDRIIASSEGDSAAVRVVTHDIWTTSPEFNLESVDHKHYGSVALTERNLLGFGKSISISYREDPSGSSRSVFLDDPSVLGSRGRFHFGASTGSSGATNQVNAGVPFYSEDTRFTGGVSWLRTTSQVHLYQRAVDLARLDQRLEEADVFWGVGGRRDGVIRRVVGSITVSDRRLGPSRLEPGAPPAFAGGEENRRQRGVAVEGRVWRPHFIERTNVNRMSLIEDFDVGRSLALRLGVAPRLLGSTADEGLARVRLEAGADTPVGFGWIRASASSRIRRDPRETLTQLDARWIHRLLWRQWLVAAASGLSGSRVSRDYQVVVGGLNGLRGFPVQALAGRQLWRLNFEDRLTLAQDHGSLVAIGAVGFFDTARTWGPGSAGAGWSSSVGTGLRIALPRWSPNQILRLDVAWPLSPLPGRSRTPGVSFGSSQAF